MKNSLHFSLNAGIAAFIAATFCLSPHASAVSPPTANPDTVIVTSLTNAVNMPTMGSIPSLLANDTDPENGTLSITQVSGASFGTASRIGNTVTYTPGPRFRGTDSFTYTIIDQEELTSTSTVTIFHPYAVNAGQFSAFVSSQSASHASTGYSVLQLDRFGGFTATLQYAGATFRFSGNFGSNGIFQGDISRDEKPPITVRLQYPLQAGVQPISLGLTVAGVTSNYSMVRNRFTTTNPCSLTGKHTAFFEIPLGKDSTVPKGHGFMVATISQLGQVLVVGRTGDNSTLSSSTVVGAETVNGNTRITAVPLYASLYSRVGSIFSENLPFTETGSQSPLGTSSVVVSGTLRWIKPVSLKDNRYPAGFTLSPTVTGARYIAPLQSTPIFPVLTGVPMNSTFRVAGGNLPTVRSERASIGNRPIAGNYWINFTNNQRLSPILIINPITGTFSGRFYDTIAKTFRSFSGVATQGAPSVRGLRGVFSGTNRAGSVVLIPDPISTR
jgi:hypothetical protein